MFHSKESLPYLQNLVRHLWHRPRSDSLARFLDPVVVPRSVVEFFQRFYGCQVVDVFALGIQSYLLRRYLDPPKLHYSASDHLLRRYNWIPRVGLIHNRFEENGILPFRGRQPCTRKRDVRGICLRGMSPTNGFCSNGPSFGGSLGGLRITHPLQAIGRE